MGIFDPTTFAGYAWVCPHCRETKANRYVERGGKKGPLCNLCKKQVIVVSVYKEHIENKQDAPAQRAEPAPEPITTGSTLTVQSCETEKLKPCGFTRCQLPATAGIKFDNCERKLYPADIQRAQQAVERDFGKAKL
jgi:hypothetical protein